MNRRDLLAALVGSAATATVAVATAPTDVPEPACGDWDGTAKLPTMPIPEPRPPVEHDIGWDANGSPVLHEYTWKTYELVVKLS